MKLAKWVQKLVLGPLIGRISALEDRVAAMPEAHRSVAGSPVRFEIMREKMKRENDLLDPAENIYCGAQVLSHLLDRCDDDTGCALIAYNVGPYSDRIQAGRRYVSKVDRYRDTLRNYPL